MDILVRSYRENYFTGEPQVLISLPLEHVGMIGFTLHDQSMLIGFFKQKQTAKEQGCMITPKNVCVGG